MTLNAVFARLRNRRNKLSQSFLKRKNFYFHSIPFYSNTELSLGGWKTESTLVEGEGSLCRLFSSFFKLKSSRLRRFA